MMVSSAAGLPLARTDILLHRPAVAYMGHIAHIDQRSIYRLDGNVVQHQGVCRAGVRADGIFACADLGSARWKSQVLRIDCRGYINRCDSFGEQRILIEVDHDLSCYAAIRRGQKGSWNRRELLANAKEPIIVNLGLVKACRLKATAE